ncbi:hypothetical protein [Streptomyces sp. RPT161]|uniref:hypothetical protein n=1 Tax=Streptomyces sp. RPT161 TaxID=3015993 RepID=UPI0022B8B67C|nr:hypothetical protein [Streptomyces sp. RPT161]
MSTWLRRHSLRLWTCLHHAFDSADPTTKWAARAVWALLTAGTCLVVGRAVTWTARAVGASERIVAWLGVLVLVAVLSVALVAVGAGPCRSLRPALTVFTLVAAPSC